jgi:hypothetical protein
MSDPKVLGYLAVLVVATFLIVSWWGEYAKALAALLAAVLVPISLAYYTNETTRQTADIGILEKFKSTHFADDNSRRLSIYLIRRIHDDELRKELRKFIFWDVMERNFSVKTGSTSKPPTSFNSDDDDWHMLGEALVDMKCQNGDFSLFREWWVAQRDYVFRRWPGRTEDLKRVYEFLDGSYFGKSWEQKGEKEQLPCRKY